MDRWLRNPTFGTGEGVCSTIPGRTRSMNPVQGCRRTALVAALGAILALNACSDVCGEVALEPSQQAFVDSMMLINGLSRSDLYIGTFYDECPTSKIYSFGTNNHSLIRIPRNVSNLTYVRSWNVDGAGLDSLPVEFIKLTKIATIGLDSNHLCSVSPAMDSFLTQRNKIWKKQQLCQ